MGGVTEMRLGCTISKSNPWHNRIVFSRSMGAAPEG